MQLAQWGIGSLQHAQQRADGRDYLQNLQQLQNHTRCEEWRGNLHAPSGMIARSVLQLVKRYTAKQMILGKLLMPLACASGNAGEAGCWCARSAASKKATTCLKFARPPAASQAGKPWALHWALLSSIAR